MGRLRSPHPNRATSPVGHRKGRSRTYGSAMTSLKPQGVRKNLNSPATERCCVGTLVQGGMHGPFGVCLEFAECRVRLSLRTERGMLEIERGTCGSAFCAAVPAADVSL